MSCQPIPSPYYNIMSTALSQLQVLIIHYWHFGVLLVAETENLIVSQFELFLSF